LTNFYSRGHRQEIDVKKLSDPITAQGQVLASTVAIGACAFHGITIRTDGTNAVTFTVWDATTVSGGDQLTPTDIEILGSDRLVSIDYDPPLLAGTGIFLEASTAGAFEAMISYDD